MHNHRKRWVLLALALALPLLGCSPQQFKVWRQWHREEPRAAVRWAVNECGDLCSDDWDRDGRVEPEPSNDPVSSDAVTSSDDSSTSDEPDQSGGSDTGGVYWPWTELAQCESGGNWSADTGNGYYGGLQFAWGSWEAVGGSGNPAHASPSEQVARAEILQDAQGWGAWPTCARIVGLL